MPDNSFIDLNNYNLKKYVYFIIQDIRYKNKIFNGWDLYDTLNNVNTIYPHVAYPIFSAYHENLCYFCGISISLWKDKYAECHRLPIINYNYEFCSHECKNFYDVV